MINNYIKIKPGYSTPSIISANKCYIETDVGVRVRIQKIVLKEKAKEFDQMSGHANKVTW